MRSQCVPFQNSFSQREQTKYSSNHRYVFGGMRSFRASFDSRRNSPPQLMQRGSRSSSPNSRNTVASCSNTPNAGGSHKYGMIRFRKSFRSINMLSVVRIVAEERRAVAINCSSEKSARQSASYPAPCSHRANPPRPPSQTKRGGSFANEVRFALGRSLD